MSVNKHMPGSHRKTSRSRPDCSQAPHSKPLGSLVANEERLRMAMDAAKIGTFDWDMKTGQVVWSENLELLAGLAPGGFGGTRESFVQLVHPEDRGRVQQAVEKAVRSRSEYGVEFRMIWPNGTQRWLQARGRPYFNDAGQPARMVGIDMDITDQKLTEQQLLIAEEKYSDFYNNAPDLLFSLDAKTGRILECNQTARDILGFSKKEIIGRPIFEFYHPDSQEPARRTWRAFLETGSVHNVELQLSRKDGNAIDISLSASAVREGREIVRSRSICRVITDLKRARRALQQSEAEARARAEELAAILDAVPAMTFIAHDPECRKMTSSRAAYELLRLPRGSNTSKSAESGESPRNFRTIKDGRELFPEELPVQQAAATGRQVRNTELTIAFNDGTSRDIFGHAVPLLDQQGRVRGAVGAFVDITEQKRMDKLKVREQVQRQLLEREILAREEERRQVARELHDESGQTLASLLAGLRLIGDAKDLRTAKFQAKKLRKIVSRAMDEVGRISRGLHPLALDDLGLDVALKNYVGEYAQLHGIKATARVTGFGSKRISRAVEAGLHRITQEALTNVAKHSKARSVKVLLTVGKQEVRLRIADDGCGFDVKRVDISSRKHLGLQGMRERASMLGGNFRVQSRAGRGTLIVVSVPVSSQDTKHPLTEL